MKLYEVTIMERVCKVFTVVADSEQHAIEKHNNGESEPKEEYGIDSVDSADLVKSVVAAPFPTNE